jgi:hypothetical protein
LFIALGHWVGKNLGSLDQIAKFKEEKISGIEHWVILGALLVAAGIVAYIWWRKRGHQAPSERLMTRVVERIDK